MTKSLFIQVLDEDVERERRQVDAVAAEISRRGTRWAAEEIVRLRRKVRQFGVPMGEAEIDAEIDAAQGNSPMVGEDE